MADEGVKYFPLYCTLDEKFELIEAEFGLKGFAIVVKLFQRIYGEHGYYCEWNNDISLIFAKQCGFSNVGEIGTLDCAEKASQSGKPKNLIDLVVAASVRRGIFDEQLFSKYSILTSRGIQRNFLNIVRNRKKVEIKKEYLLLSDAEIKENIVIINESYVRNSKSYVSSEQSKGKESKGNKSKGKEDICAELDKPAPTSNIRIPLNDKTFYDVPLEKIDEWKDAFPAVNVEEQLKRMVVWCNANPTRKKTRRGIERFIANWLSREQDRGGRYYDSVHSKNNLEEWANE